MSSYTISFATATVDHFYRPPIERFRRLPGLLITHQRAALYTARRQEMIQVVELTLFYLLQRPVVHSPMSDLPFQRCLDQDMPQLDFFSLLRENDAQFLARSGWRYGRDAPVHMPDQAVHVLPS